MADSDRPRTSVWDQFWADRSDLREVYGTDGRVVEALKQAGDWNGRTVLEVGCGSGRDGIQMALRGARVVLLDMSRPALGAARKEAALRSVHVALVLGDALSLPFKEQSFEGVFHQGLMEHFRDPSRLLAENRRVLRGGGTLLADVPQTLHAYTALKKTCMALGVWFAGWETQYTPSRLRSLLEQQGFCVQLLYGRWFRPSLAYRMLRHGAARVLGLRLPMFPKGIPGLRTVREDMGRRLRHTRIGLWTSCNVGAVARKSGQLHPDA
jgi:ubiquinone/menaquinone biosynthesis C-methylase UbiE